MIWTSLCLLAAQAAPPGFAGAEFAGPGPDPAATQSQELSTPVSTVRVEFAGLPPVDLAGERETWVSFQRLDREGKSGNGDTIVVRAALGDSEDVQVHDLVGNATYRLRFKVLGKMSNGLPVKDLNLELLSGNTEIVRLDLGYRGWGRVRLTDVPCEAAAGIRVSHTLPGALTVPGSEPIALLQPSSAILDRNGCAELFGVTDGPVKLKCELRGSSFFAQNVGRVEGQEGLALEPDATALGDGVLLAPTEPLRILWSKPGTTLAFGKPFEVSVSSPKASLSQAAPNLAVAPKRYGSFDRASVFVDGALHGSVALPVGSPWASGCFELAIWLDAPVEPNLEVTVQGYVRGGDELLFYRELGGPGCDLLPYEVPHRLEMATFAVTKGSKSTAAPWTVGRWRSAEGVSWTAQVSLPPGRYHLAFVPLKGAPIVQASPVEVSEASHATLELDLGLAQSWRIAARLAGGRKPASLSGQFALVMSGLKIWPNRDDLVEVRTFDGVPTQATLANSPGANGRVVSLRAATTTDEAVSANLIAVVPSARRAYGKIEPVTGGRLTGAEPRIPRPP